MNGQPLSTSHPEPIEPTTGDGLWRYWRAVSGWFAISHLHLSGNGRCWDVELRQDDTKEGSLRWTCGSEAEGQRLVETAVTAKARYWPG